LELKLIGSLGLLLRALRLCLIERVRPEMDAMIGSGLYVSNRLYHEILEAAAE
jgi:predicted nucleic acid-binding protein